MKVNASCPTSPEPSEKAKKYDRQLRLWDDHGQAALESSHVCLINATGAGTELLKSLVLPGVGNFTIVDNKLVTAEDLGSNFFLNKQSIGKNRGEMACGLLSELNSDVRGNFVDDSVEQLLVNSPSFFDEFQLIVANDLSEKTICDLSERLWASDIPLILIKSVGFVGYMRIQLREHTVIESHPDNAVEDLRLLNPFSELKSYLDSIDIESLSPQRLSHVPFPVLLYKHLSDYRSHSNESNILAPLTRQQKREIQDAMRKAKRTVEDRMVAVKNGDFVDTNPKTVQDAENFEEAAKAVNTVLGGLDVPSEVQRILEDCKCVELTPESSTFWVLCRALKDFVAEEGSLPVRGSLPDMTSDSDGYVALQKVYRDKAARDADVVARRVRGLLRDLGRNADSISEQEVKLFCRNSAFLRLQRGTCVAKEFRQFPKLVDLGAELESGDSDLTFYVLLRAMERFRTDFGRYPGVLDAQIELDNMQLKACVCKLLSESGTPVSIGDDYVQEITRYGAGELHSVAAFVAGCAAQEAIKLLTRQYVPVDNTMIYNAIVSKCAVYKM
ncbi:unnamed protein product [Notodromas monacha]|uniref:NEDD8-activating enzyme E1 regulatory subunit n=1 Tax=Notodromas monacha TaxID=399045 RepID=A0A7R9G9E7_9CRUS|nr:unnamed protein product [Notodromas monacha]CAG0913132.1 unnamed protein product [Notodromas monacha]